MKAAGIKLRHLPTNGGGPALIALIGNNSQALVSSIAACIGQIKGGKARALASFGAHRSHALPDVPTMKELGYDIEFYLWVGLFAPKGTPAPIVTRIRDFTREAVMTPKFKELMANIGQDVDYQDQAEFKAFWDADAKRVEDAVHSIGRVEG
jgi:tripartite-type tricarboxylate transporter receptor subunit TctC